MTPSELRAFDGLLPEAQATLGEAAFADAWSRGKAMTVEQVLAIVIDQGV
jgi:hypothetical protein